MNRTLAIEKRTSSLQGLLRQHGQHRSCWEHVFVGVLTGLLLAGGAVASSTKSEPDTTLISVSGTIMRIDPPALRMSVHDDTGRSQHFAVANVDAMTRVRKGDHVCVEIDPAGIVLNIQHTTPAPQRPTLSYASG
ncbi:MAG: hypothetical protein ACREI9_08605 [Nitrospiraceae bacterium]